MMAEIMIGRYAQHSPVSAMKKAALDSGKTSYWQTVGWTGLVSGVLILSFYSVLAGICINYILNSEDTRPVLILVEPRQISAWLKKLKKVLPPHQKINIKGSAKRLQDPKPGTVYICSKYSLHENYEDLKICIEEYMYKWIEANGWQLNLIYGPTSFRKSLLKNKKF